VIAGIEKQDGDIRLVLPQEMQNHHVFQLKAACKASGPAIMRESTFDYVSSRKLIVEI
jgi:hypothetical protein